MGASYDATMQETTSEINKMKRYSSVPPTSSMLKLSLGDHLQERIRNWLSPPDSSKNHNIARAVHYGGTSTWFTKKGYLWGIEDEQFPLIYPWERFRHSIVFNY